MEFGPPIFTLETKLTQQAAQRLGISLSKVQGVFFGGTYASGGFTNEFFKSTAVSGAVNYGANAGTGAQKSTVRCITTATANDTAVFGCGVIAGKWTGAYKWYACARVKFYGAANAAADQVFGVYDAATANVTNGAWIGVSGQASTTVINSIKHDGSTYANTSMGVAYNIGQYYVLELWRDASNLYAAIDSAAPVALGTSGLPSGATETWGTVNCRNGASAVARSVDIDYAFWAGEEDV